MNFIESLAEVDECKDAGQVVSFGILYQPAKRDDLSSGGLKPFWEMRNRGSRIGLSLFRIPRLYGFMTNEIKLMPL